MLPLGTIEETINEVKRCIKDAANGGGYILSSSNSIHNSVKIENLMTMINAAKKYGKYSSL
uniref:Uroporphyrinogen decarboxylase (URO-D) domain-containing protein n=1 Tax=Thermodesulfobacterium geofontis TaxID=1295609 RepID=A0A7V4N436_9BACT